MANVGYGLRVTVISVGRAPSVSGRYAGTDFHEVDEFVALGTDLERTETARVLTAPDWARTRY